MLGLPSYQCEHETFICYHQQLMNELPRDALCQRLCHRQDQNIYKRDCMAQPLNGMRPRAMLHHSPHYLITSIKKMY